MIDMKPMLAETADDRRAGVLLTNDEWIATQKVDGHRVLVTIEDGKVTCLNRQGKPKTTMITPQMISEFSRFHIGEWVFDGELVDGVFWLFDMPIAGNHVSPTDPLAWRLDVLDNLYGQVLADSKVVRLLPRAEGTADKQALADRVRTNGGEGVMFKNLNGKYDSGRRSRHLLKWKYVKDADCVVTRTGVDGKDNLELSVMKDGSPVAVGMCTALAGDGYKVRQGDVVAVRYAMWSGSRMIQPTLPRLRDDKEPHECTIDQFPTYSKEVLT